uniref:Uncharacterized protein n=1 Tax=Arundo donax TaxID=35708 RepID=A0A0A9A852_ARUDO
MTVVCFLSYMLSGLLALPKSLLLPNMRPKIKFSCSSISLSYWRHQSYCCYPYVRCTNIEPHTLMLFPLLSDTVPFLVISYLDLVSARNYYKWDPYNC